MVGVMLTGCGSASIAPFDYSTDGIVDINDLPAVPTRPRDVIGSGILIIPPEGFNKPDLLDGHEIPDINTFQLNIFRRGGEDSESPDGFATFGSGMLGKGTVRIEDPDSGEVIESEREGYVISNYYIGILSTTNLGAPLLEAPKTAIWPGHLYVSRLGHRVRDAEFYVDFTNGHFGFHDGNNGIGESHNGWGGLGNGGGIVISTIDGYFGNHPKAEGLNPGQMVGTFTSDWTGVPIFNDSYESTLIGLIGEEGAVGVFGAEIGKDEQTMRGGFTATNPSYTPPVEN